MVSYAIHCCYCGGHASHFKNSAFSDGRVTLVVIIESQRELCTWGSACCCTDKHVARVFFWSEGNALLNASNS